MFTQNVSFEMGHNCEFFPAVATSIPRISGRKKILFTTIYHCFIKSIQKFHIKSVIFGKATTKIRESCHFDSSSNVEIVVEYQ